MCWWNIIQVIGWISRITNIRPNINLSVVLKIVVWLLYLSRVKVHYLVIHSSMVIRDLTLRSAASFGSFHLIRLLYDEYMFYLVEHRVAQATGETAIAVMGDFSSACNMAALGN